MNNIAICIPTYKRPLMLEKLMLSIINCNKAKALLNDIHIIIVDNDINKTSEIVVEKLNEKFHNLYDIQYFNYPVKGISNARNELINQAFLLNIDFIVFVDDDEYVTSEWLNELVRTVVNNNADAARGPVIPIIDAPVSRYISCWFSNHEHFPDNTLLTDLYTSLYTGNLIIRRFSLEKYNTWFDSRFNLKGSGDIYFGIQILKKGAKLYWAAKASAFETIPEKKANLNWLIKRHYRGASTYSYILKLEKDYIKLFRKLIISIIYLIMGVLATILVMFPIRKKYWGILKISEGIGGITGIFNLLHKEYK
jgi:succinoglycan biosynthesis protein ExoM